MENTLKKPEIFILDDSFEHIHFISGFLRDNNYCVRAATNAEHFFENISKSPPDLILLDIMLPVNDGFTICRQLKKDEETKDIPVIFLTSVEDKKSTIEGFEIGGQDYIQKPVDLHILLARVNTQIKLKQKTEKLKEAYNDIENFNHMVCHDLKSPLWSIKTLSEVICEDFVKLADNDRMEMLDDLKEKAEEAAILIDKLSEISKISSDVLNIEKVDLNKLFSKSFELLLESVKDRKIELKLNNLDMVYADKILIKQVIYNILSNAVKFSKNNKETLISVSSFNERNEVLIKVKDNGQGFSMKYAKKLFNIFQRLHSDEYDGIGAGLTIVKKIIQKHSGRIWIESEEDKGTEVTFALPLRE